MKQSIANRFWPPENRGRGFQNRGNGQKFGARPEKTGATVHESGAALPKIGAVAVKAGAAVQKIGAGGFGFVVAGFENGGVAFGFGAAIVKVGATADEPGQNHSIRRAACASGCGETFECPQSAHDRWWNISKERRAGQVLFEQFFHIAVGALPTAAADAIQAEHFLCVARRLVVNKRRQ